MAKNYYVYIATNKNNTVLYTGITNNLIRRMHEHQNKTVSGFTSKYHVNKLLYYDSFSNPLDAITAEKKIKGLLRSKKILLIKNMNPNLNNLLNYIDSSADASE